MRIRAFVEPPAARRDRIELRRSPMSGGSPHHSVPPLLRTARKIFLTSDAALANCRGMNKPLTPLAAASVAALLALSACNTEPEIVDTNPDPQKEVLANAA